MMTELELLNNESNETCAKLSFIVIDKNLLNHLESERHLLNHLVNEIEELKNEVQYLKNHVEID